MPRPNRLTALAATLLTGLSCGGLRAADVDDRVILISLDTVAARHLELYGYHRETAPNLARFAAESTVFLNAYATAPKTAESHMSMFTSLHPSVHGVATVVDPKKVLVLDESIQTLAEILSAYDYETIGFHSGGMVAPAFGFGRGFDRYEQNALWGALEWFEEQGSLLGTAPERYFLFVHTYEAHDPYVPGVPYDAAFTDPDYDGGIIGSRTELEKLAGSNEWRATYETYWNSVDKEDPRDVAHLAALYDGQIAELDARFGKLIGLIDEHAPNALVIVLSDHGEEFGQHGEFTHEQLYGEVLHVPLIVRRPDHPGGVRVESAVSLIDLAPTILDMLSIPIPEQFQGRSLLGYFEGGGEERPVFSEWPKGGLRAVRLAGLKLLEGAAGVELYDLRADPLERVDLGTTADPEQLEQMRSQLLHAIGANEAKRRALGVSATAGKLDEQVLDELRALGYVRD